LSYNRTSKNELAFNLKDVRKLDPDFHTQQLNYWHTQGYIKPLAGGYYILVDRAMDEMGLFSPGMSTYLIKEPWKTGSINSWSI
jgi:hypothetical protein